MVLTSKTPDLHQILKWLCSNDVVKSGGEVLSWTNHEHPGYAYPEAAALLLTLLSCEEVATDSTRKFIKRALINDVSAAGGLGRGEHQFLFDTAIALNALLAYEMTGRSIPDPQVIQKMFRFIEVLIQQKSATQIDSEAENGHWSMNYGCHELKVVIALTAFYERTGSERALDLVKTLSDDLLPLYENGRFRVHSKSGASYLHSNCYAIEGCLNLYERSLADVGSMIEEGSVWLSKIQDESGGIPAWHDGTESSGDLHADATAQAVRIWTCVDPRWFASHINKAMGFLRDLQSPHGGIYYKPGSNDVNTWTSIFTVQAIRWRTIGGEPLEII